MYDDERTGFTHSYFNRGPITEDSDESYSGDAKPKTTETGWNHSLADVLTALLSRGLVLEAFAEHDYSPHRCCTDMTERTPGRYQWQGFEGTIPMSYALRAREPG